ncbi:MAG: tetratricopeptide repeat protein [Bacteroidetes bacterium]|nr:tetratricopeptide repeat protein [Bacteroidota bacterium]
MKNQSLQTLGLAVITAVALTSCTGLGKLVKNADKITYKVTPDPMEMHGDSITVNISGTYPAKVFPKKATVTTTPIIKYNGGEKALKPLVLIGEKVEGTGMKISNSKGGNFSYTDKVAYTPEMKVATLEIKASGAVKKKTKELPNKKVADGTIITPLLVKADDKAIIGKDDFKKVIPHSETAQIFFVINQSQVRGTEMNSAEMKALKAYITSSITNPNIMFKNMNISAYASPDGELTLNANLAENRAKETRKAMEAAFKDKKMKVEAAQKDEFYNIVTTAEDWDGFKKAMEASSIADKDLILRVLTMYPDGETREKEIKNLSKTYTEVADKILPKLRRSVMTLNVDVNSRTDEQITKLAMSAPDSLSVEEILYAATLTQDINTKLDIYKKAETKYGSDWRTSNNVGMVYLMQNKLNDAEAEFKKADGLSANNPVIKNNLGIVARWKGDRKAAMDMYKSASAAGPDVAYNMGIIEIQNGNYAAAVADFGSNNSFNAALAKLLNGNTDGAMSTIDNSTEKDAALSFYLKAIAGARQGKADVMNNNLKAAIQKDASFKQMAKDDAEFIKFRDNADFKAMVN